jgi:hypothetical protein
MMQAAPNMILQRENFLVPEEDRTCKRCSVRRVDALVDAYVQAHNQGGNYWISRLRQIDRLCRERGFDQGTRLLQAGLAEKELRALCWNVSSFLKDQEAESILGIKLT